MQTTTKFELVDIDRLIPYARNARIHSKEQILQLRSSLREFGFVNPVIVDKDFNIIAGHGRVLAAKAEGMTEIPCVFVEHLTEAQKKAYILADNRLALSAGWDEELLALEFADLKDLGFDLGLTGFDEKEIEKLFEIEAEAAEDDFDVDAELEKPVFSVSGDIWTLGRHRLIVGDSTKPETYASLMDGKQANLIMTDPPYGIDYDKGSAGKIKNDKFDSDEQFYTFLFDAFKNMAGVLANDGAAYVFHADSKGLTFRRAFENAGFKLSGCCIWAKNTFTLGRSDYQWCHEPCLYGWKKSGKHNWYGDRKQSTIWHCDKPSRSEKHPTMKPVPLLAPPIQNSTQTNGVVLDPFGGSGSTLICCEQLNRQCYMIELDPKFADVIVNRYIEAVGSSDGVAVERDGRQVPYGGGEYQWVTTTGFQMMALLDTEN
jgi:DNA modification methylase